MQSCFTQTKSEPRKNPKKKTSPHNKLWRLLVRNAPVEPKNILTAREDKISDYILMPTYLSDDTQSHHHDLIKTLKEKLNIKTEILSKDDTKKILHDYMNNCGDVQSDATLGLFGLLNEYGDMGGDDVTKENITKLISAYRMVISEADNITALENYNHIPFLFLKAGQGTPHYMSGILHKKSETECDLFLSDPLKNIDLKYSFDTNKNKSYSEVIKILKNIDFHADNQTRRIITGEMQTNFGEPSTEIPNRPVQKGLSCGFESVLRMMDNAGANIRGILSDDKKTEPVDISPVKKDNVMRMLKACMGFAE